MAADARLIYTSSIKRGRYVRLFLRALLGALAAGGAWLALTEIVNQGIAAQAGIAPALLDAGRAIAVVVAVWLAARSIYHLVLAIVRRTETIRIYNRGMQWGTARRNAKATWGQVAAFREGVRGLYLFNRPVMQWGSHRITFADKTALVFRPHHGDGRVFARAVRPYAARVTGARIGQYLRQEQPVRLHKRLIVHPGGVEANGQEIHWDDLHLARAGGRLIVRWRDAARSGQGKRAWRTAGRFSIASVDSVDGLMEVWKGVAQTRQAARSRSR